MLSLRYWSTMRATWTGLILPIPNDSTILGWLVFHIVLYGISNNKEEEEEEEEEWGGRGVWWSMRRNIEGRKVWVLLVEKFIFSSNLFSSFIKKIVTALYFFLWLPLFNFSFNYVFTWIIFYSNYTFLCFNLIYKIMIYFHIFYDKIKR